jgi:hypothetical protein
MTTISNGSPPRIDEPRIIKPKSTVFTPAVLLVIAAGVLTALNVLAAVYTYRSTSNLIAIEGRLGELKAFEERVAGQLDMMNNGIQSRLEALQSDFRGQIGGLHNEVTSLAVPSSTNDDAAVAGEEVLPVTPPEPAPDLAADVPQEIEVELPVAPVKKTASSSAPEKSSSYERIQSPNGKVYYRKVQ